LLSDNSRLTGKNHLSLSMNLGIRFSWLGVNSKAYPLATPGASRGRVAQITQTQKVGRAVLCAPSLGVSRSEITSVLEFCGAQRTARPTLIPFGQHAPHTASGAPNSDSARFAGNRLFVPIRRSALRLPRCCMGQCAAAPRDSCRSWLQRGTGDSPTGKNHSVFGYEPRTLTKLQCSPRSWMALTTLRSCTWPLQSMKKKYSHAFRLLGRDSIFVMFIL